MRGIARHSPSARKITDIEHRITRLEQFESWANCVPLNVKELVSPKLWDQYYAMQEEILNRMRDAQKLATEIGREIRSQVGDHHV